jgi:hypothetical protein
VWRDRRRLPAATMRKKIPRITLATNSEVVKRRNKRKTTLDCHGPDKESKRNPDKKEPKKSPDKKETKKKALGE